MVGVDDVAVDDNANVGVGVDNAVSVAVDDTVGIAVGIVGIAVAVSDAHRRAAAGEPRRFRND